MALQNAIVKQDMSDFGKKIRAARREKKISLRKLASQLGISFTYLSKIESGEMAPPAENKIYNIADKLGLDVDELFILAQKLPQELSDLALRPEMPKILRATKGLSQNELRELLETINNSER